MPSEYDLDRYDEYRRNRYRGDPQDEREYRIMRELDHYRKRIDEYAYEVREYRDIIKAKDQIIIDLNNKNKDLQAEIFRLNHPQNRAAENTDFLEI